MATIKCDKVKISVARGKEIKLLETLQKFGNTELIRKGTSHLLHADLEAERNELQDQSELLSEAIKVLSKENKKPSFVESLEDKRVEVSESQLKEVQEKKEKYLQEAKEAIELDTAQSQAKEKLEKVKRQLKDLELFKEIEAELLGKFTYVFVTPFIVLNTEKEAFIQELKNSFKDLVISEESTNEVSSAYVVAGPKEQQEMVMAMLIDRTTLIELDLPKSLSPKEAYADLLKEKEELQKLIVQQNAELKKTAHDSKHFFILKDILNWDMQKLEALDSFEINEEQSTVDLWIDPNLLEEIKREIHLVDKHAQIALYNLPIDQRKVALRNLNFFKSFELVTTTMGYPGAKELDPTPILTPFFILFFGLALSDAGYGLILALIGGYFAFFKKVKPGLIGMVNVIFWCGISTIIFGALMGSWFGFVPDYYQMAADSNFFIAAINPVIEGLKWAMIVDPVANIPMMLGIMLSIGIVHMVTGFTAGFIGKVLHKDLLNGLLDDLLPGALLLSVYFFGISKVIPSLASADIILQYVVLVLLGLTIIAKGRAAGIIKCIPVGILQTFMTVVGFLSETLSYARLLALGIATGVIAGVINLLAFMTAGTPWIGFIFVSIALLVGHTINILLNVLGSYITSSRLQFVEFFPKFMSASGKPLIRFRRSEESVIIKKA